jgi:hypothetical protein
MYRLWKRWTIGLLLITAIAKFVGYISVDWRHLPSDPVFGIKQEDLLLVSAIVEVLVIGLVILFNKRLRSLLVVSVLLISIVAYRIAAPMSAPCNCMGKALGMLGLTEKVESHIVLTILIALIVMTACQLFLECRERISLRGLTQTGRVAALVIVASFIAIELRIIAHDPYILGADEGMEYAKALLVQREPIRLHEAWNDQPWLYSFIFAKVCGSSLALARLLTLAVVITAVFTFGKHLDSTIQKGSMLCFACFFFLWPDVLHLSASAMMEFPAYLLCMIGLACYIHALSSSNWKFLFLSAILSGVACAIKLTALILGPAFLAYTFVFLARSRNLGNTVNLMMPLVALATFCGIWISLLRTGGNMSLEMLWTSHRTAAALIPEHLLDDRSLSLTHFLHSPGLTIIGVVGLALSVRDKRRELIAIGVVPFVVALVVHTLNRPFWFYYTIHFAFPLAVGACYLLKCLGQALSKTLPDSEEGILEMPRLRHLSQTIVMMAFGVGVVGGVEGKEFTSEMVLLPRIPKYGDLPIAQSIKQYSPYVQIAWSPNNMLLAQSGILQVIPLTIVPQKRFWIGDVSYAKILMQLERARPGMLLLTAAQMQVSEWIGYLKKDYLLIDSDNEHYLWVRSDIVQEAPRSLLKTMNEIVR